MRIWTKPCVPALALLLLGASAGAVAAGDCAGDCDADRSVTVAELVTLINVALGELEVDDCLAGDANGNGAIEVDDLIAAINQALFGCRDVEPGPFKTRVDHPWEPFFVFGSTGDGSSWGKFTLRVDDPAIVYFQNSNLMPFHQEFVAASLPPYIGWTPAEIDAVSLHAEGQELVFGAVLYSPGEPHEIAIQLVRQDPYTVAEVIAYFEAVRAAIGAAPGVPVFYFPTFEQRESAVANEAALAAAGIRLGSPSRWSGGDSCYAHGWAHGRLVQVEGDDIAAAYADGRLRPDDILLTDGVPAEIPFVAGVVSLTPSTPNSHVAILAADWEIPFAFLSQPESVDAAQALVGHTVVLRATTLTPQIFTGSDVDYGECQVRLVDVGDSLGEEVEAHLRALKRAPDLQLRPFEHAGSYVREVNTATPDDIVYIGGKAANYGFLLRRTPANTRPAMAFTFDLWDEYLDQTLDGGKTLRRRIVELLAPFPSFPPDDFAALYDALDDVRDLIDDEADFTDAQKQAIVAALDRFDPLRRIHFRSSTNVEDSDLFTGAGLYDSESGCLADDIDDDTAGPSRCDPERAGERGVFRALRKVFLSFYSDNAFLERLRHRVDETTVGMAVLVHHTFVDETELANGVAALRVTGPTTAFATIVSQPGVYSVTNPEDDGVPEVVEASSFGTSVYPSLRQGAERLPLGATVLDWQNEYVQLMNLLRAVAEAFGTFHGETQFDIEFEFKKVEGEGLVLRQVRRMPRAADAETTPVLIDAPTSLCTFQGEYSDAFAIHRLKSRWNPAFVSGIVDVDATLYAEAPHAYVLGAGVATLEGGPAAWPGALHESFVADTDEVLGLRDSWDVGAGATRRRMALSTFVPTSVGPARLPIVFPDDCGFQLEATHDVQVPFLDYPRQPAKRTDDLVRLVPCRDEEAPREGEVPVRRQFDVDGLAFDIGLHWPPSPDGAVAGYTAPLVRWTGTTLGGGGVPAAALEGWFSQTYRPGHHNFTESYVFEPRLEEGIAPSVRQAWDAAGLRAVVVEAGYTSPPLFGWTLDDELIDLAPSR
jgi:hypothetical protein